MTVAAPKQRAPTKAATPAKAAAPPGHVASSSGPTLVVQRCACQHGIAEDQRFFATPIRRKCASCAAEEELQRRVFQRCAECEGADGAPSPAQTGIADVVRSGYGAPLDAPTRGYFEPRFGRDLSDVRIHTGASADAAARSINALAYTVGEHVVVRSGYFAPQSDTGRHLLAHELAHTVQQRETAATLPTSPQSYSISSPDEPAEREADRVGAVVSAGGIAPPIAAARTKVARQDHPPPAAVTGGGTAVAAPPPPPVATVDQSAVSAAVDIIIDRVEGYTTWWNSRDILAQFAGKDAATTRAILSEVSNRLSGGIEKMFNDMTEEDRNTLRDLLIRRHVLEYVLRLVALSIKDLLEGYTSEDDSHEILSIFGQGQEPPRFEGDALDRLLLELTSVVGEGENGARDWLFEDMDRVSAWRLEEFFYANGGPRALSWAAEWSAAAIYDLIEGYTSHADSTSIVSRFRHVPQEARDYVLHRLDVITRRERDQSAEDSLMEDMDESDYQRLRQMGGLTLRAYDYSPPWYEAAWYTIVSIVDWGLVIVQWLACGIVGIVTGLLSVIWDIVKIVIDIVVGVYDLVAAVVYGVSGGAAGSAEWLKVKQFFQGIGQFARHPIDSVSALWHRMWEDIELEFTTIEGPFTECRVAELFMRKVVNLIATILLTIFTGYAAVKAGLEGLTALRSFATLVREVGFARAVAQVVAETRVGVRAAVALRAARLGELVEVLRAPRQLITRIGTRLRGVMMVARDEGYFNFVRARAGAAGREVIAGEGESWARLSERWDSRALTLDERRTRLAERVRLLEDELAARRALRGDDAPLGPEDRDTATQIDETAANTHQVDQDTAALEREVSGQPPEGVREPSVPGQGPGGAEVEPGQPPQGEGVGPARPGEGEEVQPTPPPQQGATARGPGDLDISNWEWPPRAPTGEPPPFDAPNAFEWRYRRYRYEAAQAGRGPTIGRGPNEILSPQDYYDRHFRVAAGGGRPGRPGSVAHQTDVARNNGPPNNLTAQAVGDTVPDGVGRPGEAVTIRGQRIAPQGGGRVLVESDHTIANETLPDSAARAQVRAMRAGDPNATIVVTSTDNPTAAPIIYRPGTQPPPSGRLPPNTPTHVPYP